MRGTGKVYLAIKYQHIAGIICKIEDIYVNFVILFGVFILLLNIHITTPLKMAQIKLLIWELIAKTFLPTKPFIVKIFGFNVWVKESVDLYKIKNVIIMIKFADKNIRNNSLYVIFFDNLLESRMQLLRYSSLSSMYWSIIPFTTQAIKTKYNE